VRFTFMYALVSLGLGLQHIVGLPSVLIT